MTTTDQKLRELKAALPVGARVRHTSTGKEGVVTIQPASCAPISGVDSATAHVVDSFKDLGMVSVRMDHRDFSVWYVADYFEAVPPESG